MNNGEEQLTVLEIFGRREDFFSSQFLDHYRHFAMKIQPINSQAPEWVGPVEPVKPATKSRLKRLFERQFTSVLKNSVAGKICDADEPRSSREGLCEFEPSSVCLAKMVQNFIEENNGGSSSEKQSGAVRCGRNCFNGNYNDSSEDELDSFGVFGDSNLSSSGEACDILKVYTHTSRLVSGSVFLFS